MHSYDFRCNACHQRFTLHYKSYTDYDAARPVCPDCGSADLVRIISKVAIQCHKPQRDYRDMSAGELNAAIRSPDSRQVGEVFRQMTENEPDVTPEFQEVTKRLLKGEDMDRIEREVALPDQVPDKPTLAKELIDLKIRHVKHHQDHHHADHSD